MMRLSRSSLFMPISLRHEEPSYVMSYEHVARSLPGVSHRSGES